jgi:diadenosine tetraphosphate (Ap4A) HIT family hydrolase
MGFALHERLARDAFVIGDVPLSRVLMMNNARWPWLILVPMREGAVELTDLDAGHRALLIEEAALPARVLKARTNALKVNLGARGNIVLQLHLHVVARTPGDPAWPGPVWGYRAAATHAEAAPQPLIDAVRKGLGV